LGQIRSGARVIKRKLKDASDAAKIQAETTKEMLKFERDAVGLEGEILYKGGIVVLNKKFGTGMCNSEWYHNLTPEGQETARKIVAEEVYRKPLWRSNDLYDLHKTIERRTKAECRDKKGF